MSGAQLETAQRGPPRIPVLLNRKKYANAAARLPSAGKRPLLKLTGAPAKQTKATVKKPAAHRLAADAAANQAAVTKSLVARPLVDSAGIVAAQPANEGQGLAASGKPPMPRAAKGVKRKVPQKGTDIAGLGTENEAPQVAQGSKEAAGRPSPPYVVKPGGLDISISALCFQCSILYGAHQRCRCWPFLFSNFRLC